MYAVFNLWNANVATVYRNEGLHVIRDLYEWEQIRGKGVDSRWKRLRIRRGSRMDQWNDDRGWAIAHNRKGGGDRISTGAVDPYDRNQQIKVCQVLLTRAKGTRAPSYQSWSIKWAKRPNRSLLIANHKKVWPWHNESLTGRDYDGRKVKMRSNVMTACDSPKKQLVTLPVDEEEIPGSN